MADTKDKPKEPKAAPSAAEQMQRKANKAKHSERVLNGGKK